MSNLDAYHPITVQEALTEATDALNRHEATPVAPRELDPIIETSFTETT